jgi:hypothetical protein
VQHVHSHSLTKQKSAVVARSVPAIGTTAKRAVEWIVYETNNDLNRQVRRGTQRKRENATKILATEGTEITEESRKTIEISFVSSP